MTKTTFTAPVHTISGKPAPGNNNNNPDAAPSLSWGGGGLQDLRWPYNQSNKPNQPTTADAPNILGFMTDGEIRTVGGIPSAVSTTNIAPAASVAQGTPMALVSVTGAGMTVLSSATLLLPSQNTVPAGTIAMDGPVGYFKFGYGFQSWYYDPGTMIARSVSITGVSGGTGGNFLISGYDLYGYPQTQLLTVAAGSNTANTTKPFKYISSVVPQFTDATHNYSVGTADIYDLGLAAGTFSDIQVYWVGIVQLLSTFTAAVTTSPATNLTGGTRGTFTPGSSSDGVKRLDIFVEPPPGRIAQAAAGGQSGSAMAIGLFGVLPA